MKRVISGNSIVILYCLFKKDPSICSMYRQHYITYYLVLHTVFQYLVIHLLLFYYYNNTLITFGANAC